jgi:hypothetical protein
MVRIYARLRAKEACSRYHADHCGDNVDIIDQLVERRITEAIARGDFDALPGVGRPLEIDDDRLVPEELRVAHRIMKNAGFVPEELRLFSEIRSVEQLLMQARAGDTHVAASARLRVLLERLGSCRAMPLQSQAQYFDRLIERLGGSTPCS